MGSWTSLFVGFLVVGIAIAAGAYYLLFCCTPTEIPKIPDIYWGRGQRIRDNEEIVKFKIDIQQEVLEDLKTRLTKTKFSEPLEDVEFQYGFNANQLREVVKYWKDKYDWRKQEKELNKYDHYKTQIDGISVHFVRAKPANVPAGTKVVPILMSHGWPGSFYEFYKTIPLLTKPRPGQDFVFEVIVPSIPGYGFSEAPHKKGFSAIQVAKLFDKLMTRLGFDKYYIQGGDWGAIITTAMAVMYPQRVLGVHTNAGLNDSPLSRAKAVVGSVLPSLIYEKDDLPHVRCLKETFMFLLGESGYFLIQATKPDTVGAALQDSPAGLAAYILEKFSTGTNKANREKANGGLTEKFTMDELLTNVMIYWVNDAMTSAQRLYKESIASPDGRALANRFPVRVPAGLFMCPNEIPLWNMPKTIYTDRYLDLLSYTRVTAKSCGHFAALEEPQLFSDDVWSFVSAVQKRQTKV